MKKHLMPATESSLGQRAFVATLKFVLALAVLILVPAGSISYWQGWLLWANISIWCAALTWYLLKHDPALLERRLAGPGAETEPVQKRIRLFASLFVIGVFVVAALDYRFGWSVVPVAFVIAGNMLVFLGFVIVFLVFRENSFASATIEVAPDQRVISTGPYALVRHPMYGGRCFCSLAFRWLSAPGGDRCQCCWWSRVLSRDWSMRNCISCGICADMRSTAKRSGIGWCRACGED